MQPICVLTHDLTHRAKAVVPPLQGQHHQAFLGDLNTMAHGIARLSLDFCRDRMRLLSLGQSEGGWFERNVLAFHDARFNPSSDARRSDSAQGLQGEEVPPVNQHLAFWGLPQAVCTDALNPGASTPICLCACGLYVIG